jgi:hypothetical protein
LILSRIEAADEEDEGKGFSPSSIAPVKRGITLKIGYPPQLVIQLLGRIHPKPS